MHRDQMYRDLKLRNKITELIIISTSNQMHRDHLHMDLETLLKTNHQYLKDGDGLQPSYSASMKYKKYMHTTAHQEKDSMYRDY
jgi:hypothetical protein